MPKRIVVFGPTGATGAHIVKQALSAGLAVRAFVRSPDKIPPDVRGNPQLEIFQGDLADLVAVDKAIAGADALIVTVMNSAASKNKFMTAFVTQAVQSMRKNGVKRLIFQAGAFSSPPGQTTPTMLRVLRSIVGVFTSMEPVLADNDSVMAYLVNNAPDIDWTVTRPAMIKEAPSKGPLKVSPKPGPATTFTDLAAFLLATAQSNACVHEMPYLMY